MLSRVAKIVLAKAVLKRRQSTRKLAKKLTEKGHPVSKTTVDNYMTECLGPNLRRQPKLTEAQKRKRLAFSRERKNWTILDWRRVLFSDESAFELMHSQNSQNEHVWAHSSGEVSAIDMVK